MTEKRREEEETELRRWVERERAKLEDLKQVCEKLEATEEADLAVIMDAYDLTGRSEGGSEVRVARGACKLKHQKQAAEVVWWEESPGGE